jgi:hypothetical protein
MTAPTTLREEIRQTLAASKDPLTRPEIFEKCKLAGDEAALSTVLSQLCNAGDIKKAGERERVGARALALYTRGVDSAGEGVKKKKPRAEKPAAKKRGPYKKRAKAARPAKKSRSARLPKAQRRTAGSPAPQAPGFRCGVFSDGSMNLERSGETFSMTEPEVRVLFAYLEKTLAEARA